jgi:hypothetical protein
MLRRHFLQLSSYSGAALVLSFHWPANPRNPSTPAARSSMLASGLASGLLFPYSR